LVRPAARVPERLCLVDLSAGASATVSALAVEPGLGHRLEALGIKPGQQVRVLRRGWWSGPIHLRVGMTELMLRRVDAARVEVLAGDPSPVNP